MPSLLQSTLAVLFVALAVAGCTAPDDADGPDGTDGASTTTSQTTSGGTETPAPSGSSTVSFTTTEGPGHDLGLQANGTMHPCGADSPDAGDRCFFVQAENVGEEPFNVSNICVPPWLDAMARDGEPVQPREPIAYCAAFGTRPVAPGETVHGRFTWDERLWDDGDARSEDAPSGTYDWTATLTYYWNEQTFSANLTVQVTVA